MPDGRTAGFLALVVALGVVLGVVAPAGAATADSVTSSDPAAPTQIEGCTAITESGEYVLANDIENGSPTDPRTGLGACIAVRADDVTLRGGNHTVAAGPGGEPGVVGVLVSGRTRARGAMLPGVLVGGGSATGDGSRASNVTVQNLTTARWGAGVAVVGATDATLRNVSAVSNLGDGFFVENAPGIELRDGEIRGSNTGVFLRNSPDARLADLTVAENLAGVSVRRSDGATVSGIDATGNSQFGLAVFASENATISDSTFAGNGFAEVALSQSDDARLRNLTIAGETPGWALYATNDSTAVGERVGIGATRLSFEVRDAALDAASGVPPLPLTERQVVGEPVSAVPIGEDANLSLSVEYTDTAVERASTTEDTLSLWRFDADEGWNRVETAVDVGQNRASATFGNLSENGTVIALVGEGLAESANETDAGNQSAFSSPASKYSCWTSTTSVESSQSA